MYLNHLFLPVLYIYVHVLVLFNASSSPILTYSISKTTFVDLNLQYLAYLLGSYFKVTTYFNKSKVHKSIKKTFISSAHSAYSSLYSHPNKFTQLPILLRNQIYKARSTRSQTTSYLRGNAEEFFRFKLHYKTILT